MSVKYQLLIKFIALALVLTAACAFVLTSCAASSSLDIIADQFRASVGQGRELVTEVFTSAPAAAAAVTPVG